MLQIAGIINHDGSVTGGGSAAQCGIAEIGVGCQSRVGSIVGNNRRFGKFLQNPPPQAKSL